MNILSTTIGILCVCAQACWAQSPGTFPLWPGEVPGALGTNDWDVPTLTHYAPESAKPTGASMVILPGGGYGGLAAHEGEGYAKWFTRHGIHAFVLKYRLGSRGYRHPIMLQDAARAVRLVRHQAGNWDLDIHRVGIIGSSAGGHLASTLLTHFDLGRPAASDSVERQSCRPDIGILCYPVITMTELTHGGSRRNLLGDNPSEKLIELLSNEKQVTSQTPPCFIWHTWEDTAVKVENSLNFAAALRRAGVPFDLHIYQQGRHGLGLGDNHPWTADCLFWLKVQKFVP